MQMAGEGWGVHGCYIFTMSLFRQMGMLGGAIHPSPKGKGPRFVPELVFC